MSAHVANLESTWATYIVGLPHALSLLTPEAGIEAALAGLGCEPGDAVLLVGDPPPYVVSGVTRSGALCVPIGSLADANADRATAVGVVVSHAPEGILPWYDDLVRWCMREGLWIVEDCGTRLDLGRASHVAVWSLVGGVVACLDAGVAGRMREWRARTGFGMTEEMAEAALGAVVRARTSSGAP